MGAIPSRPWTEPELRQLVEMSRSGMRLAAIALRLGRGYDSVRYMSRKLGVDLPAIGKTAAEQLLHSPACLKLYESAGSSSAAWMHIVVAAKRLDSQVQFADSALIPVERKEAVFLSADAIDNSAVLELQDGLLISDSAAITEYLDNLDGEPLLTGRTLREKAIIQMMHRRAESTLRATLLANAPPLKNLAYLDEILRERPFIAGDAFSMADISLLTGLATARRARSALPQLSALASWHARVYQLPSVAAVMER